MVTIVVILGIIVVVVFVLMMLRLVVVEAQVYCSLSGYGDCLCWAGDGGCSDIARFVLVLRMMLVVVAALYDLVMVEVTLVKNVH